MTNEIHLKDYSSPNCSQNVGHIPIRLDELFLPNHSPSAPQHSSRPLGDLHIITEMPGIAPFYSFSYSTSGLALGYEMWMKWPQVNKFAGNNELASYLTLFFLQIQGGDESLVWALIKEISQGHHSGRLGLLCSNFSPAAFLLRVPIHPRRIKGRHETLLHAQGPR